MPDSRSEGGRNPMSGSPRVDRTVPPGPAAVAAAVLLLASAAFSLLLGVFLLARASDASRISRDFGLSFGRGILVVFGLIAIGTSLAKVASAVGVLARRPWAAVLGIVLASLDAFFTLPALGGSGTGL